MLETILLHMMMPFMIVFLYHEMNIRLVISSFGTLGFPLILSIIYPFLISADNLREEIDISF